MALNTNMKPSCSIVHSICVMMVIILMIKISWCTSHAVDQTNGISIMNFWHWMPSYYSVTKPDNIHFILMIVFQCFKIAKLYLIYIFESMIFLFFFLHIIKRLVFMMCIKSLDIFVSCFCFCFLFLLFIYFYCQNTLNMHASYIHI